MPYLPQVDPHLFFLGQFPASNQAYTRNGFVDEVTLYSTNDSSWYPYLSCGWFPVLVIYPGLHPIPAHAWVHTSPDCTPPTIGARTVLPNSIYVGRQFIHSFRALEA
jgi:hypothetical protein